MASAKYSNGREYTIEPVMCDYCGKLRTCDIVAIEPVTVYACRDCQRD